METFEDRRTHVVQLRAIHKPYVTVTIGDYVTWIHPLFQQNNVDTVLHTLIQTCGIGPFLVEDIIMHFSGFIMFKFLDDFGKYQYINIELFTKHETETSFEETTYEEIFGCYHDIEGVSYPLFVGDMVRWRVLDYLTREGYILQRHIQKYGHGPFEIRNMEVAETPYRDVVLTIHGNGKTGRIHKDWFLPAIIY